jgi:hypothetical protein
MATFHAVNQVHTSDWIPLVEYAHKKGISLSTLRRHIKAGKIPYKVDQGRYLLFDDSPSAHGTTSAAASTSSDRNSERIAALQLELQRAREEIAELKTLIAFYEDKTHYQRPADL